MNVFLLFSIIFSASKMSKEQKSKMKGGGKGKDVGNANSGSDHENEPKKRGKRFSQMETDLLLNLVMNSNVNSMETNRMTTKGRSMGWDAITTSFNASPGVVVSVQLFCTSTLFVSILISFFFKQQRTEKELRDRASNIRKDLYKLSRFQKESTLATGGGHLPPRKPPSVSFDLTEVVKKYAVSLQVKLAGLAPVGNDNVSLPVDEMPSTPKTTLNLFDDEMESSSLSTPIHTVAAVATAASSNHEISMSTTTLSTSTTSALPSSSSQMFATQRQRRRKRNTDGVETWHSNSNSSNSLFSAASSNNSATEMYFEKKSQLLADENQRRDEWHKRCMDIKNGELVMKKKQTAFWSKILDGNSLIHFMQFFDSFLISFPFVSADKYRRNSEHCYSNEHRQPHQLRHQLSIRTCIFLCIRTTRAIK